ncbi:type II toxin-antitoxin system VapC family toxin [Deferrisoma camini]|uniref:type II toxin-antitoxin system VapC family toxin n=1 Tax=Deferrisoma camini TaxID=1035120 RepID=UPI0004B9D179|nr:type II toxin-antitoxin system VapC family toxin [Deferrisoma camini]
MGVLIDTCVWIDVERGVLHPEQVQRITGDHPVYLSPVTVAELRLGVEIADREDVRQRRQRALERLLTKPVLPIDAMTGQVFGRLAAALRKRGSGHRRRVRDLWLASQAVQHGYFLLTRNQKDFEGIPELQLLTIEEKRRRRKGERRSVR